MYHYKSVCLAKHLTTPACYTNHNIELKTMNLFVGSYTQTISEEITGRGHGLYCFDFNDQTGELSLRHTTAETNPTYFCLSADRRTLFSLQELAQQDHPMASAYRVEDDGILTLSNQQPIPGGYPCHISLSEKGDYAVISCYETGHVLCYSVAERTLGPLAASIQHTGSSINSLRQETPHPHQAVFDPHTQQWLVCDLGIDQVMHYRLDETSTSVTFTSAEHTILPPGSGPRHLAFHPGGQYWLVLNELTATVSVCHRESGQVLGTYPTLPDDYTGLPHAAAIRISPDGRFVYTSHRSDFNAIAISAFDEASVTLTLLAHTPTQGRTPRDFLLSADGHWLIVANQDSDSLVVFRRNSTTGLLTFVGKNTQALTPVCLQWAL